LFIPTVEAPIPVPGSQAGLSALELLGQIWAISAKRKREGCNPSLSWPVENDLSRPV